MTTLRIPLSRITPPVEPGLYVAEASDLRIPPGQPYPDVIEADGGPESELFLTFRRIDIRRVYSGNDDLLGQTFDRDGDLIAQDYRTESGSAVLRLFND